MAKLGVPYRFFYEAKGFATGITPGTINARVFKPNGAIAGIYPLTEVANSWFAGHYYFDFPTSSADPEGNYLMVIHSLSENWIAAQSIYFELDVWEEEIKPGETFGDFVLNKLLTVSKFLGLK